MNKLLTFLVCISLQILLVSAQDFYVNHRYIGNIAQEQMQQSYMNQFSTELNVHDNSTSIMQMIRLWQQKKKEVAHNVQQWEYKNQWLDEHKNRILFQKSQVRPLTVEEIFFSAQYNLVNYSLCQKDTIADMHNKYQRLKHIRDMSEPQQRQYLNDYKFYHKDFPANIHSASLFIKYLSTQLDIDKEAFVASTNELRVKYEYAHWSKYFNRIYAFLNAGIQQDKKRIDVLQQEEDLLCDNLIHQFDIIQTTSNEKLIRLTRTLLQFQKDKEAEAIKKIERRQAKQIRCMQEKLERDCMTNEDILAEALRFDLQKQQAHRLQCEQVERQRLFDIAEQEKQEAAKQAKKEKERAKKQRQKQAVRKLKEQVAQSVIQEQVEQLPLASQVEAPSLMTYEKFVVSVEQNEKNFLDYMEQVRNLSLTTAQKNNLLSEYCKKNIPDGHIFDLLWNYSNEACNENITDESLARLQEFSQLIIKMHKQIALDNLHMSWYLHCHKDGHNAIWDRYKELHSKYSDKNEVAIYKEKVEEFLSHSKNTQIALAKYSQSIDIIKNELQKMQNDPAVEQSKLVLKKEEMKDFLVKTKLAKDLLVTLDRSYNFFQNKVRGAQVYSIMSQLHAKGGILDTLPLSSVIDSSARQDSTFASGVLEAKMSLIKNEMDKFIEQKHMLQAQSITIVDVYKSLSLPIYEVLIPLFKNIWIKVGITEEDCDRLASEIQVPFDKLVRMPVFDIDSVEFHLHYNFTCHNNSENRNYSLAQINDVVKIQRMLIEQLALFFKE